MSQTRRAPAPSQTDESIDQRGGERTGSGRVDALSPAEVFDILSSHRRRFTIQHLRRNGGRADIGDLAEHVAARENDEDVDEVTRTERKRVYTSLQQFHLPKLVETGVVVLDSRSGAVELASNASEVEGHLQAVDQPEIPWSRYYVGLAAASCTVIGGAVVGVAPFGAIPELVLGGTIAVSFLLVALIHASTDRSERSEV